mgnify:CR=1 FL=1
MDLKELLKRREEANKIREEKSLVEFTLESYKDTVFKLKVPDFKAFIELCGKIGITDFTISKKEIERIFAEKITKSNAEARRLIEQRGIALNGEILEDTDLAGELMVELKAQSRAGIIKSFFTDNEIMEILILVINKQTALFESSKNPNVVELKKK